MRRILIHLYLHSNQIKEHLKIENNLKKASVLVISVYLMNFFQKYIQNVLGKLKLETPPELEMEGTVYWESKTYSINIKPNDFNSKHKTLQQHNKYTLEG